MLFMPAIDVLGGRCVRLRQGDFAAATRYAVSPQELLLHYRSHGVHSMHLVDLDGARHGGAANHGLLRSLAALGVAQLQVGGGIRTADTVQQLLDAGVARVVVGSAAVERVAEVAAWLERFGPERLCLAFDVRLDAAGEPRVRTRGWTQPGGRSLWGALGAFPAGGVRHVLCTDIARDGMLSGPNLALYREALARFPDLAWQGSGGVRDAADLAALARLGVAAAVSGRAVLERRISFEELRPFLPDASSPASTCVPARS